MRRLRLTASHVRALHATEAVLTEQSLVLEYVDVTPYTGIPRGGKLERPGYNLIGRIGGGDQFSSTCLFLDRQRTEVLLIQADQVRINCRRYRVVDDRPQPLLQRIS